MTGQGKIPKQVRKHLVLRVHLGEVMQRRFEQALLWVYIEVSVLSPWEDGCSSDEGSRLKCKGPALNSLL